MLSSSELEACPVSSGSLRANVLLLVLKDCCKASTGLAATAVAYALPWLSLLLHASGGFPAALKACLCLLCECAAGAAADAGNKQAAAGMAVSQPTMLCSQACSIRQCICTERESIC